METNDYSYITSFAQLKAARKALTKEIAAYEMKNILLSLIRKFRNSLSGTPFAKS